MASIVALHYESGAPGRARPGGRAPILSGAERQNEPAGGTRSHAGKFFLRRRGNRGQPESPVPVHRALCVAQPRTSLRSVTPAPAAVQAFPCLARGPESGGRDAGFPVGLFEQSFIDEGL